MKADQLISRYLAKSGSVSLQGLGRFYFEGNAGFSVGNLESTPQFPEESVRYEFDKNTAEDQAFIDFLSEQTGKKRSLIASDLDSFIHTGKQFLNIGKPLVIKDLGILTKNQTGTYEFTQGSNTHEPIDVSAPKSNHKQSNPDDIDFSSVPKNRRKSKSVLLILIPALVFLAVLFAVGFYYSGNANESPQSNIVSTNNTDKLKDSIIQYLPVTDTNSFILTKEFTDLGQAQKLQSEFLKSGYNFQINAIDSNAFVVSVTVVRPLSDTFYFKDSIQKKLKVLFDIKNIKKP